ncbi:MAG: PTS cellobiose transporter subunit IIB [Ileibacterium sp.]|nr:PTS cellobiose transporter subunit IIB [Ileibacterium sp.]
MTNVLIICAAGMSSSLFAKKAGIILNKKGFDVKIEARCMMEGEDLIRKNRYDLYLVSPQAKLYMDAFEKAAGNSGAKLVQIPANCYVPIPAGFEKLSDMIQPYLKGEC